MSKRDILVNTLDGIRMPEAVYKKTLSAMLKQPRQTSGGGAGRVIAIAASLTLLTVGIGLLWYFLSDKSNEVILPPPTESVIPTETDAPISPSPTPSATPDPSASPSPVRVNWDEVLIDLDWPEPDPYAPEFKVFPTVSTEMVYKTHMAGPVTFLDENLDVFPLPVQLQSYALIYNWDYTEPIAYAVNMRVEEYFIDGWYHDYWCLMFADGTMARGSDGEYIRLEDIGMDGASFYTVGNLVMTARVVDNPDGDGTMTLNGIYDIKAQREVLPPEYEIEWSSPFGDGIFGAVKDGEFLLFDNKGNELYSFGQSPGHALYAFGYDMDSDGRLFYRRSDLQALGYNSVYRWDEYFIVSKGTGDGFSLDILDAGGRVVYETTNLERIAARTDNEPYRTQDGRHLAFERDDTVILVDKAFNEMVFQIPEELQTNEIQSFFDVLYEENGELIIEIDDRANFDRLPYALDEAGNLRRLGLDVVAEDNIVRSRTEEKIIVFDDNGDRWLELPYFDDAEAIWYNSVGIYGDFAVYTVWNGAEMEMRAVYSVEQKRLLLDNIYGAIYEKLLPDGGMFVYTAPDNCVVLYPDGRTVPVPNAPVVEKVYFGG